MAKSCWETVKPAIKTPLQAFIFILKATPLINFVYYVFFNNAPCIDDIIEMSNSNLLVSALLFTVVAAIPLSITQEEMNKADYDYGVTGKYGCHWYAASDMCSECGPVNSIVSISLCQSSFRAILCTLASILLAFICLLSISSLPEVKDDDEDDMWDNDTPEAKEEKEKKLKLWWGWAGRWILCFSSLSLIGGIGFSGTALQHVVEVRWHNVYRYERCQDAGWRFDEMDERTEAESYTVPAGWDYSSNNTIGAYSLFDEAADQSVSPIGIVWQGMVLTLSLVSLSALMSGYLLLAGEFNIFCMKWYPAPTKTDEDGQIQAGPPSKSNQKHAGPKSDSIAKLTRDKGLERNDDETITSTGSAETDMAMVVAMKQLLFNQHEHDVPKVLEACRNLARRLKALEDKLEAGQQQQAGLSSDGSNDDWLNKPPYTNTGPNNVPANDDDGYVVPLAASTNTGAKGKWAVGRNATRANYTENQPEGFGFEQPAHSGKANAFGGAVIQAMAGRTDNTNNDDSEDEMNC